MQKLPKIITAAVCLYSLLLANETRAGILYWDNNGASAATSGTWNTTSAQWASTSALTASPSVWDNVAGVGNLAVFCAGSTTNVVNITVNSAINVAGIYNGELTPPGCVLTIGGAGGSLNMTGTQGIYTAGSDGYPTTINIPITGSVKIEPEGPNQLFLNATNTYTGGTLLAQSGIVNFNNSASFGTGTITMSASGGALVAEGSSAITIPNAWTAAAVNLNIVGNAAGITFSGPWNLAATPGIGSGVAGNLIIFSGVMSGAGGIVKFNPAILRLSGANTYTGLTTVSNGTLQLGAAGGFPSGSGKGNMSVLVGGVLDLHGLSGNVNGLSGTGLVTNGTGTGTLTLGNNAQSSEFDGVIAGALNIVKAGTGAFTVTGTNIYSGATTVSGGTLRVNGTKSVPYSSTLTVASGAFLDVTSNTAPLLGNLFGTGAVTNNATHTLTVSNNFSTAASLTTYSAFSGVLASGSFLKDGTSSMSLRGSNANAAATTTVNNGILSVGAAPNRLPTDNSLVLNGGIFQLDANNQTIATLSGTGTINLGGQLILNGSGSSFNGTIQDSEFAGIPTDQGHGLRGYYYSNQDLSTLATVRDDSNIFFTDFTGIELPPSLFPKFNNISIRWLGQVQSTAAGIYSFVTTTDDGARLWVNGSLLIDNWAAAAGSKTNTITLAANTRYDIVMEYFNQTGNCSAILSWQPPGDSALSVIPTDNLYLPAPGKLVQASGSLVLNGASTYSGGTLISGGSIEAAESNTLGNGNVTIADGATLILDISGCLGTNADLIFTGANPSVDIEFLGGANPIHGLSFDGGATYQPPGTYGPIGSGANHESSLFTGSGNGLFLVTAKPSAAALVSSGPSTYGSAVTFTATVTGSGGTPTGIVTLLDGASAIGTAALSGGVATFAISDFLATTSPHSVTAVYGGDANFSTSTSTSVSQVVNRLAVSQGTFTAANKTYDGTTSATILTLPIIGVLPSDTNSAYFTASASFIDKTAAFGKTVNIAGLTISGSMAGNYFTGATGGVATASIAPKALTVTGITAQNKPFDGTTSATLVFGTPALVGVIGSDSVTLVTNTAVGTFSTATVGNAKTVTINGLTPGNTDGGNYTITSPTTTANITKGISSSLIVSSQNPSQLNSNVTFTVTVSGAGGTPSGSVIFLTNSVALGTVPLTSGVGATNTASLPGGTNTITVQYAGDATYLGITNSISQVVSTAPPSLTIANAGTNVIVSWTGTFTLQGSPFLSTNGLTSGWTNIAGATSPYTNAITGSAQFFRLTQ